MKRSKYIGNIFDEGWKVTKCIIAGRYGARKKLKGNSYSYILTRMSSDGICEKSLTVGHNTMVKIARGLTTVETVEKNKTKTKFKNSASYMFLKK